MGIVEDLFGDKLPEGWGNKGDQYLNSFIRGASPQGMLGGMVDLSNLIMSPITKNVSQEKVVGGSKWFESLGMLPPEQKGVDNETIEMLSGLINPVGSMRAATGLKAIPQTIRMTRGQASGNFEDLALEQRFATKPRYAQRVAEYKKKQAEDIRKVAANISPDVAKLQTDAMYGTRVKDNFRKFMEREDKIFKEDNKLDFDRATAGMNGLKVVPTSPKAAKSLNDWVDYRLKLEGNNPDEIAELMHLKAEATRLFEQPQSLLKLKENLQYNVRELADSKAMNPFSKSTHDAQIQYQREIDKALKIQLEEARAVMPEAEALVQARANFLDRKKDLDAIKDQTIMRFFDLKDAQQLIPEKIVENMKNRTPTELDFFEFVADSMGSSMAKQLKRKMFDDLIDAGLEAGGSAIEGGAAKWNPTKFLEAYDNMKPELRKFIIPQDPASLDAFNKMVEDTRKVTSKVSTMTGESKAAELAASGAAGMATGVTPMIFRGSIEGITDVWRLRESVYNKMYGIDKEPGGLIEAAKKTVGQSLPAVGADVGRDIATAKDESLNPSPVAPSQAPIDVQTPPEPQQQPVGPVSAPADDFTVELTPEERALRAKQKGANAGEQVMAGKVAAPLAPYDDNSIEAEFAREKARVQSVMRELQMLKPGDPRRAILEKELE